MLDREPAGSLVARGFVGDVETNLPEIERRRGLQLPVLLKRDDDPSTSSHASFSPQKGQNWIGLEYTGGRNSLTTAHQVPRI